MNRYFYYSILLGMLMNTILYVPNILITNKHDGVILGILVSTLIGSLLTFMSSKAMATFQSQGLPEIFSMNVSKFFRGIMLFYFGVMWFIAGGLIVLVSFTIIIKRFILPETPSEIIIILFMTVVCWCASRPTKTILYLLEIVMVLNLPLITFILYKAMTNKYMNWYAIWNVASDHIMVLPNLDVLAAATFIFTGHINMVIFNKESNGQFNPKFLWLVPIIGLTVLLTTFFIPIGTHGTVGVDQFNYAWVSTADSMKVNLGFIERVVYVFLLLYLNLSLLFATVTWHVGYHLIKDIAQNKLYIGPFRLKPIIFGSFMLITLLFIFRNEKLNIEFGLTWLKIRFYTESALVLYVFYLSRRGKKTW